MKKEYVDVLIAVDIEGMSRKEYAAHTSEKPNTVSHRLQRAEKKFCEIFGIVSHSGPRRG